MKRILLFCTIVIVFNCLNSSSLFGQASPLFADQTPLKIKLKVSLKDVRKETNDTTYMDGILHYETAGNVWDSIQVSLRTRGDFRLKNCFFPPLRVKIKKKDAKGTLFEGNKSLKLVVPCKKSKDNNGLIVREYMCYKVYELLTPYTFSTRLVDLDFTDQGGKKDSEYQLTGFFIEDDDVVADRFDAKVMENLNLHPKALHDTTAVRHDLFQYFIANIDWSTTFLHNAKIIQTKDPFRNIPLTYDFDQSGFVNASYATLNPEFDMVSVTDRVYRGFCRANNGVVEYVRNQFIGLEGDIDNILNQYKTDMTDKEFAQLQRFVGDFFKIMKNDNLFKSEVLDKCRTN